MSDIDARHRALLQTLAEHHVRFVLVGGVALQNHGYSGSTRDVDVAIATDPTNRHRVAAALQALDAREYLAGHRGTAHDTRFGRLAIMTLTDGIGDYAAWARDALPVDLAEGLHLAVGDVSDDCPSVCGLGRVVTRRGRAPRPVQGPLCSRTPDPAGA